MLIFPKEDATSFRDNLTRPESKKAYAFGDNLTLGPANRQHGVQVYETGAKDGRGRGRRNNSFDALSETCSTSIFENGSKVEFRETSEAEKVGLNSGSTYYREEGPQGPTRRSSLRCSPRCRSFQLDCHATLWLAMTGMPRRPLTSLRLKNYDCSHSPGIS